MAKTYYELLDVPPTASADEIKRAFRREIAKYHPDKVQHLGEEFQEIAATKAAELTRAYKTLTDSGARAPITTPTASLPMGRAGPAAAVSAAGFIVGSGPGSRRRTRLRQPSRPVLRRSFRRSAPARTTSFDAPR